MRTFAVNTVGPMLMFKHFGGFLPQKGTEMNSSSSSSSSSNSGIDDGAVHGEGEGQEFILPPHALWLNMAARVGSTSDNALGGWYSYRASKAGVISLTKGEDIWARMRAGDKAIVMAYHPGTVKTGLSEEFWKGVPDGRLFGVELAVRKMMGVVGGLGTERRGRCWDWKGGEILP